MNVLYIRDHPFKTSAFFRGGGVKKFDKFANGRGVRVKNREKLADVLNEWSLIRYFLYFRKNVHNYHAEPM